MFVQAQTYTVCQKWTLYSLDDHNFENKENVKRHLEL